MLKKIFISILIIVACIVAVVVLSYAFAHGLTYLLLAIARISQRPLEIMILLGTIVGVFVALAWWHS